MPVWNRRLRSAPRIADAQPRACAIGGGATRPWRGDQAVNSTLDLATVLSPSSPRPWSCPAPRQDRYTSSIRTHEFQLRATHGMSEELIAELNRQGIDLSERTFADAAAKKQPVQVADLKDAPPSPVLNILLRAGYRALLIVPLLGPEGLIGMLVIRRRRPASSPNIRSTCCRPSRHNRCWRSRTPICSRRWRKRAASSNWRASTSRSSSPA